MFTPKKVQKSSLQYYHNWKKSQKSMILCASVQDVIIRLDINVWMTRSTFSSNLNFSVFKINSGFCGGSYGELIPVNSGISP